jgi:iron(III) transport system ATP-binding protein
LSNLDAKLRRRVREDIRGLQQSLGLTVVYVTHDQEEALAVSDRIVVMHSARIVQDGTPRDLYERPANRFIADFIGNANLLPASLQGRDGALAVVRIGDITLRLPHRDLPPGAVEVALRPQAIRLRPGERQAGELAGTVRKAAYLGSHMEYQVELSESAAEVFVIAGDVQAALAPGAAVGVTLLADGAALVPAGEAA